MKYIWLLIVLVIISCSPNSAYQEVSSPQEESQPHLDTIISSAVQYEILTEDLEGSKITIAAPVSWNKKILIIAHGYRPQESELSSDFSVKDPFYQELLTQGWIIASTSYRSNGLIILEAVEDIETLRKFLEETYGKADEIYLQGSSMGATISTLIAEDQNLPYTGVLAIGFPRFHLHEADGFKHNFNPQIPILFLSNRDETEAPKDYVIKAEEAIVKPAFWSIDRDGHCAVNSNELIQAFNALTTFIQTGQIEYHRDGTILVELIDLLADHKDGRAYTEVLNVNPAYGNFVIKLNRIDMEKLAIGKGTYFKIGFRNRHFRIYYGTTYSDVRQGFWVAFDTSEGLMRIARNFADAAGTIHCVQGDTIYIEALPAEDSKTMPYIEPGTEAVDLGISSWEALISGDPQLAINLAEQGLALSPDLLWLKMNLAHAYLFSGEYDKAVEIYLKNKGEHVFKESFYFEDLVLEDLDKLENEGIYSADFEKIRELLKK